MAISGRPDGFPRLRALVVRLWRFAALAVAAFLLHKAVPPAPPFQSSLAEARAFFPEASRLQPGPDQRLHAFNAEGALLGALAQTSPAADGVIGYSGPSNLLVALDAEGKIVGIKILSSGDTTTHVDALRSSTPFAASLHGWDPARGKPPIPEGVGGSTLTALAMLEALTHRFHGVPLSLRFPEPLAFEEVQRLFPGAAAHAPDPVRPAWTRVTDKEGHLLGYVLRTSPASDAITGYAGPSESLLALAPDRQTLLKVHLRKSYDTEDYVQRIPDDPDYLKMLTRWSLSQWPSVDFEAEKIEGVAGATLTSYAIAEGIKRRAQHEAALEKATGVPRRFALPAGKDLALAGILLGALLMGFTRLRGNVRARSAWQLTLVGVLGLGLGQLLSLGLLTGWARHGLPWKTALPLVVFAGLALLLPWGTRRQLYCHQICPHGALQEWAGKLWRRPLVLSGVWHGILRLVPGLVLAAAFLAALWTPTLSLGGWEPFDFWSLGGAAAISGCLAAVGVVAAVFVPMAYCRYGCATGALLGFVRSSSSSEGFTRRDAAALCVLAIGAVLLPLRESRRVSDADHAPQHAAVPEARGTGFGTTWCVKARGAKADALPDLRGALQGEVERIEATLSHWRPGSATNRFNAEASTRFQDAPQELVKLVGFTQDLSARSAGAYDITVAPLVAAWGYGPAGPVERPPDAVVLSRLLERVGYRKLECGADGRSLRKTHPDLAIDLGSVLQGYAVDALARLLDNAGIAEYLIEVGGELRARGAWPVAIENPADRDRVLCTLTLRDAALATSGLERARRKLAGATVSHILSPKTGMPVEGGWETVSVQAATCLEADGWATALLAADPNSAHSIAAHEGLRIWYTDAARAFHAPRP